jgi:hypothetical protein
MVLAMGASVGGKTKAGMPVFVEACKSAVEYQAMCLMLLEEGVNPNLVEEVTLLYLQVFLFKVLELLLERYSQLTVLIEINAFLQN